MSRFSKGDKVTSEYGPGVVADITDRSVTVKLDSGETLNIQRGTPGYDRLRNVDKGEPERAARGGFRW